MGLPAIKEGSLIYFGEEIKNSGLHVGRKTGKPHREEDVTEKMFHGVKKKKKDTTYKPPTLTLLDSLPQGCWGQCRMPENKRRRKRLNVC